MLAERTALMIPGYKQMFAARGGVTPTDPLEFHLFHLARYWSRLVGFCRQDSDKPEIYVETDLGACVQVGSDFANELIRADSPIFEQWGKYMMIEHSILFDRPVSMTDIESASKAFDECLVALKYNPWPNWRKAN